MFEYQPKLEGTKVKLRPLREQDYSLLFEVASDPKIWEQHPASNRHEPKAFRIFFDDALESGGTLVVIDTDTDLIIGSTRFNGHDKFEDEIEIGWTFLSRHYWGGSYNYQIKQLMLNHAFKFVSKVVFIVGPENIRSQRAVEKIGAVRSGFRLDGSDLRSFAYVISKSDFNSNATR